MAVNEITDGKGTKKTVLNANITNERIQKWETHLSNLFGTPTQIIEGEIAPKIDRELPINDGNFTLEEFNTWLKSLKNNQTSGPDKIPAEVWKTEALSAELLNVHNKI